MDLGKLEKEATKLVDERGGMKSVEEDAMDDDGPGRDRTYDLG